ncbi:MAG: CPBP family intramembrane metalloprotease [Planctomycetaceae bacterium]|nr:MAG: CPBP family intramembrane metalloprotease [Planctomycetaceae bacterium]
MSAESWFQGLEVATYVAAAASLGMWIFLVRARIAPRKPLVEPVGRPATRWTLAEFFLCFGLWLVCLTAAVMTVQKYWGVPVAEGDAETTISLSPEGLMASAIGMTIVNSLVLICLATHMGLVNRAALEAAGLWPARRDLRLGLIAALAILPPVLLLATLLDKLIPYEHPVYEAIGREPSLGLFLAMALGTALISPVLEEFMFRSLLQGGFQRLARLSEARRTAAEGDSSTPPEAARLQDAEWIGRDEVASWPWWPVVSSSMVFSFMHLGHGAAPASLFVLALGLGYLYRQTGRLWPCIVVHVVLNGFSMLGFGLKMLAGG